MTRDEIEDTKPTLAGLCDLAKRLGYTRSPTLWNRISPASLRSLLSFLEDNPGAIEAVLEWAGAHCAGTEEVPPESHDEANI